MSTMERIGKREFRTALSAAEIKGTAIMHGALAIGILLFSLIMLFMAWQQGAFSSAQGEGLADVAAADSVRTLSLIHIVLALIAWGFSTWAFGMALRMGRNRAGGSGAERASQIVSSIRGAGIARLALLEAPALLGLVTCLIAAGDGVLRAQPIYWLNALSALIFVVYVLATFPTRARLEAIFEAHFTR